jgi:hypothetical protein
MTITIELPPEVEGRLIAEAQRKGVPVGEIVKAYLVQSASFPPEAASMRPEEREKALDALFDSLNVPNGIQEGAFHRENWYR